MESTQTVGAIDFTRALRIIEELSPVASSDIIPLLQRLQDAYGYLPREVILEVCKCTGLPASRVFGVATFYSQFHLKPRARHLVRCCRGTACHVKGGKRSRPSSSGANWAWRRAALPKTGGSPSRPWPVWAPAFSPRW